MKFGHRPLEALWQVFNMLTNGVELSAQAELALALVRK